VNVLENAERKERRDAKRDVTKFKKINLGNEFDLIESDTGYRLIPMKQWFEGVG
jgi:hypothetical protein